LNENSQVGYLKAPVTPARISKNLKKKGYSRFFLMMLGYPDSRVDYASPFLAVPESYLQPHEILYYRVDGNYNLANNYQDLLRMNNFSIGYTPDYVLIELPPILYYSYPPGLITSADMAILVCRANRVWSSADQGALDTFMKMTSIKPLYLLNGVDLMVVETILGNIPKKRSRFRRVLKKILRFQFFSRYNP
jgi:hypothetical protein